MKLSGKGRNIDCIYVNAVAMRELRRSKNSFISTRKKNTHLILSNFSSLSLSYLLSRSHLEWFFALQIKKNWIFLFFSFYNILNKCAEQWCVMIGNIIWKFILFNEVKFLCGRIFFLLLLILWFPRRIFIRILWAFFKIQDEKEIRAYRIWIILIKLSRKFSY